MRIGIDCRKILDPSSNEQAGIAHYTYYLVKNLLEEDQKNEYVLFFDKRTLDVSEFQRPHVSIRYLPFYQYKRYLPFTYSHLLISAFLEKEKLDLFHSPFPSLPLAYKRPCIMTVHDLAIYHHPNWFPTNFGKQIFSTRVLVPQGMKKSNRIIVPSEFTKKDCIDLFKIPENKIKVIYEGVAPEPRPSENSLEAMHAKFSLKQNYVLYLGTIEPRKNIEGIIEAFLDIHRTNPEYADVLAIAGGKGWKNAKILKMIARAKDVVRYIGPVSHEDKLALIAGAKAFVWPSLYEGFGLPVLEAMMLRTPVLTSNVSALPEVVGDAAITVNPKKNAEIIAGLKTILSKSSVRMNLIEEGIKRSQMFSWKKTAKETLEVYKKALKK